MDRFQRRSNVADNDEDEEQEEEENEEKEEKNLHFSNKIEDPNDPCVGEITIEEVRCGHDLSACKNGLYGIPGKNDKHLIKYFF